MSDYILLTVVGILSSVAFGAYVLFSRKTNARQKSLDTKAVRDEIIAARKRNKIKTDSPAENDIIPIKTERDKWFTVFLYCMIAVLAFLIINNIAVIIQNNNTDDLNEIAEGFVIIKCILYIVEIALYSLLLIKMKRNIAITYVVFIAFSLFMSIFTLDAISLIRAIPVYFVFKSQWHNFE